MSALDKLKDQENPLLNKVIGLFDKDKDNGIHKGESKSLNSEGKKYSTGFTPEVDFYQNPDKLNPETHLPIEFGDLNLNNDSVKGGRSDQITKTDGSGTVDKDNITPSAFYVDPTQINPNTGLPIEYGERHINPNGDPIETNEKIKTKKATYDNFNDFSGKKFTHLLDEIEGGITKSIPTPIQGTDGKISSPNTESIYLGSFIRTLDDNEDPTIMGYDITIKTDSSPLFNGSIDEFITSQTNNSEVNSRLNTLNEFKKQFKRYFRIDTPSSGDQTIDPKTYYLKKITGLDNLVEQNTSDKTKSFIEYGKDMIGLSINEDVSTNMGYLSSLYKSLTWSRIHGKQIIPENLLRFDVNITITEIRKYNRILKSPNSNNDLTIYSDLLSKYIYTLYECQFFFPKMPHGSEIDMSNAKMIDDFEIIFNYKFSTMKFLKFFGPNNDGKAKSFIIDNESINLNQIKSINTNNTTVQNNIIKNDSPIFKYSSYSEYKNESEKLSSQSNDIEGIKKQDKSKKGPNKNIPTTSQIMNDEKKTLKKLKKKNSAFKQLEKDIANAFIKQVNKQITIQARLLNKTLDNIRNANYGMSRMSEPTNVYDKNIEVKDDITNAFRDFAGKSVKGFFTPGGLFSK